MGKGRGAGEKPGTANEVRLREYFTPGKKLRTGFLL